MRVLSGIVIGIFAAVLFVSAVIIIVPFLIALMVAVIVVTEIQVRLKRRKGD